MDEPFQSFKFVGFVDLIDRRQQRHRAQLMKHQSGDSATDAKVVDSWCRLVGSWKELRQVCIRMTGASSTAWPLQITNCRGPAVRQAQPRIAKTNSDLGPMPRRLPSIAGAFFDRIAHDADPVAVLKALVNTADPAFETETLDFKVQPRDDNGLKEIWSKALRVADHRVFERFAD